MNSKQLERVLDDQLEDNSFEEVLEMFDLTPFEVFEILYDEGLLEESILERLLASDGI